MTKIIEKTVVSKYAPHDTNVDWLDVSGDKPVKKSYINGKWQVIGGGDAGSSNPTEADATKVWQVTPVLKETKTEETVIVPEQTLVDGQELEYNDKFVPGAQCVAVINGVEYRGEVVESKGGEYVFEVNEFGFEYRPSRETFQFWNGNIESPEATVKLSVIEETPIYDYNWAPGVKIPIPTAKDKGKTLVVNGVEVGSEEYELAPKQTITITGIPEVLQNASNLDKFVEGSIVTVVIDNTTHTGTVTNRKDGLEAMLDNDDVVIYDEGLLGYYSSSAGTYEVSVSVLEKEYSYEYQLTDNVKGCDLTNLECFNNSAIYTADNLQDILNDGYTYVYFGNNNTGELYIVKIEGDNPSYNNGQFIDCSPVVIPSFLVDMYKSPWRDTTPVLFHACRIYSSTNISYEFRRNVFGFDFNSNFNSSGNGYDFDKVKGLGIAENGPGKFILGAYWRGSVN